MNSEERRSRRRQRREERRRQKKEQRIMTCTVEQVASLDTLYRAALCCRKGVSWKASVQKYFIRLLPNLLHTKKKLLCGKSIHQGFHEFRLWDNGKIRDITSTKFSERVVDKAYTKVALVPLLVPSFIRTNTANTTGRGTADAHKQLKKSLVKYFAKHGNDGYILLLDFSTFFASLQHWYIKEFLQEIPDELLLFHIFEHINACGDGEVGLGLGSEPNQVCAVSYPSRIDHYVLETCDVFAYGRYMDDIYIIDKSKEHLLNVYNQILKLCDIYGLVLNPKKYRLVKLSHGFTFLKKKYHFTDTGKIIVRPSRAKVAQQRRKLKKLHAIYLRGEISFEQVETSFNSWKGALRRCNARKTIYSMEKLFAQLFEKELANGRP